MEAARTRQRGRDRGRGATPGSAPARGPRSRRDENTTDSKKHAFSNFERRAVTQTQGESHSQTCRRDQTQTRRAPERSDCHERREGSEGERRERAETDTGDRRCAVSLIGGDDRRSTRWTRRAPPTPPPRAVCPPDSLRGGLLIEIIELSARVLDAHDHTLLRLPQRVSARDSARLHVHAHLDDAPGEHQRDVLLR